MTTHEHETTTDGICRYCGHQVEESIESGAQAGGEYINKRLAQIIKASFRDNMEDIKTLIDEIYCDGYKDRQDELDDICINCDRPILHDCNAK